MTLMCYNLSIKTGLKVLVTPPTPQTPNLFRRIDAMFKILHQLQPELPFKIPHGGKRQGSGRKPLSPEEKEIAAQKHRDRMREASRMRYRANPEEKRAASRLTNKGRYSKNPQRFKEYLKKWREQNPERPAFYTQMREARKRKNGGEYTLQEWQALCAWFDYKCLKCGQAKALTVDHVLPISKGGLNVIENLQPLCKSCNCSKHVNICDYRDKHEFQRFLKFIREG
jgi:5-methylcytosine-specific restriction endonuclease McrA